MAVAVFVGGPKDGAEWQVPDPPPPYLKMAEFTGNVYALETEHLDHPVFSIKERYYRREGLADNGAIKYRYVP